MTTDGLTVTYGSLVITGVDGAGVDWHVFDPITGWDGSPASTLELTQKPRAAGSFIGNTPQLAQRVIVLTGVISAPDHDALQTALDQLVAAVTLAPQTLSIVRGSTTRTATVYRQDEVLINGQHDTVADFSIQCVAPDPRRLGTVLTGLSLTNAGTINGPLSLRLDGPATNPTITQVAPSGTKTISLPAYALASGHYLIIGSVDVQSVLLDGTARADGSLVSRQWMAFEPGVNTFSTSSGTLSATAQSAW